MDIADRTKREETSDLGNILNHDQFRFSNALENYLSKDRLHIVYSDAIDSWQDFKRQHTSTSIYLCESRSTLSY